ncbi:uncharacterized protein LOC116601446 [Nematostella vectensis]|uniref:uncharacterized protein LOC116601446 n=1 Tax=Nematostella vectensis TaxID=45351 RepID=UPI002077010B|nr:uncharacterized protein LOC116601446 [Nematostella vectensis]
MVPLSGSTTVICRPESCNIGQVLQGIANNTRVILQPGDYLLDRNLALAYLENVTIYGSSGVKTDVHIRCKPDFGFYFSRSRGISFSGFTVSNCGASHVSTSLYNVTVKAAFQFIYCRDLSIKSVSVSNNTAIGVNLYDVGGEVQFIDSHFLHNRSPNNSLPKRGGQRSVGGGGGVYVQFTYCGAYYGDSCNDDDNAEHENYMHHNNYTIENCLFSDNFAPGPPKLPGQKNTDFLPPQGRDHMSLGRGGGLSIYIRGNASYNHFLITGCNFTNNFAQWGGGFFAELVDSCNHNMVMIREAIFDRNSAKWAGGGLRYGLIQVFSGMQPYNNGTFVKCNFNENSAIWGGACSVYSTEEMATSDGRASSEINFVDSKWTKNTASNGAAIGLASWKILAAGGIVIPKLTNSYFSQNKIVDYLLDSNRTSDFSYSVVEGQGAVCTNAMPLHFLGRNQFLSNSGTAVLLTDASMNVNGEMEFIGNNGHDGGGISIMGQSWIVIYPGTNFLFSKNRAIRGAAIYAEYPGTPNRVASKNCFITYTGKSTADSLISPEQWKTHFNFSYNNATVAGHSIYASTLKYCEWYMEVFGFKSIQIFNWTNFVYENVSPLPGYEITTDPVDVSFDKNDWANVSPSDVLNPSVELRDERQQLLPGIVFVSINNTNESNAAVDVSTGPYFPAKDRIYSFQLKGKSKEPFSLIMQTVTGRTIKGVIRNISLQDCRPGYYMSSDDTCLCMKSPTSPYSNSSYSRGITRCQGDRDVFIRKGLWAGMVGGDVSLFVTYPCPPMYCDFSCTSNGACAPHEYLFLKDPARQCAGHRTGTLCGECQRGYSVVLGSDQCKVCPQDNTWVGYLILFLVLGTFVVVGVLILNVDISTGHYTGCLFFYQVVSLLVRDGFEADPVLTVLMGLANAQVGFGACMWHGMTDMEKLAFTYVLPTYILFLCGVVIVLSRRRFCVFSKRSALRAFATLFLVSYTTFTSVSLELLHFASFHGELVLFKSGEVPYFRGPHLVLGIVAILVGVVIVLPFPFVLVFMQPLSYLKPGFAGRWRLKPFLDIFQGGYKTDYQWFSGVYYLARIALLCIYTFGFDGAMRHSLMAAICLLLLTLLANIRPYGTTIPHSQVYQNTWINLLDSLILADLTFIALLGSFSASSDSAFTSLVSPEYSAADYVCIFLMWIPMVYFFAILAINIRRVCIKRRARLRRENEAAETSPDYTTKTPSSFGFDDE